MKALKIILIILITPFVISGVAYLVYQPEDYCFKAEYTKKMYEELSSELGISYYKYMSLGETERLKLFTDNQDYMMMKVAYEQNIEAEQFCIAYIDINKYDRFVIDVFSGNYFKD